MGKADHLEEFLDYYEYLNLPQDASIEGIQVAFDELVISTQMRLNNSLTANQALYVHNIVEPAIRRDLLSGQEARANYDRQLLAYQEYQNQRGDLADEEGLDDFLEQPFFFDPFKFDVETPANTLREIALKMDEEWSQSCKWLTSTTDDVHIFQGFLLHSAGRPGLVKRVEPIIQAVSGKGQRPMGINEAVERCIMLFNPENERPLVSIHNATFDGRIWQVGDFIVDVPAQSELILGHDGLRGCVFGTIESRTAWVTFARNATKVGFSLMPEGTDPLIGLSEIKIPLFFRLNESRFAPNTDYQAELLIRQENHQPVRTISLFITLHVLPTPPRVLFNPPATLQQPIWVGVARQGEPVIAYVTATNRAGDQALVPLSGQITTSDPAASTEPQIFQHESQIALSVDTGKRPRGQKYGVVFQIDYGATPGVLGPKTLHLTGEIVPTPWQSMQRLGVTSKRVGMGILGLSAGSILLTILGAILSGVGMNAWLLFVCTPAIFGWPIYLIWKILLAHRRIARETPSALEKLSSWIVWGIPTVVGLCLFLLCATIGGWSIGVSVLIGGLLGGLLGFVADGVLTRRPQDIVAV